MGVTRIRICIAIVLLFGLTLSACTSIRPRIDYSPDTDFARYQTFAWISENPLIRPRDIADPFVSPLDLQRIQRAIESELTAKGFQQLDDVQQADFIVSFTVGT